MSTLTSSVLAAVRGPKHAAKPGAEEEEARLAAAKPDDGETDPDDDGDGNGTGEDGDPDDKTDPEMAVETVRRAEQDRIRAILTHPKADAQPGLAAELAFGERFYSAEEAASLLSTASAAPANARLADRMQGKSPKIGSDPAASTTSGGKEAIVADMKSIMASFHKR